MYYKGIVILLFIFEHIMVQEILCNNYKTQEQIKGISGTILMCNVHSYFFLKNLGKKSAHYTWQNMVIIIFVLVMVSQLQIRQNFILIALTMCSLLYINYTSKKLF